MNEPMITTQPNLGLPKVIPRRLFKNNKTHDETQIDTEQISLILQIHYKIVSTEDLILKEKKYYGTYAVKYIKKE